MLLYRFPVNFLEIFMSFIQDFIEVLILLLQHNLKFITTFVTFTNMKELTVKNHLIQVK